MLWRVTVGSTQQWREFPGPLDGLEWTLQPRNALGCPECQQLKPRNILKLGWLQSSPIPKRIWTDISMDFIVGLLSLRGCDSI